MAWIKAPRIRLKFNQAGLMIVLACLLLAFVPNLLSLTFGAIVTLTVNALSESIELVLKPQRTYSWRLPPGTFVLIDGGGDGCKGEPPDVSCVFAQNSTLRVTGGPTLMLESMPDGKFLLSLEPAADTAMHIEVLGPYGDTLATSGQLAFFESNANAPEVRLPMIADSARLGSLLHESSADMGPGESILQPMLREGRYAAFASVGRQRTRFALIDGQFDPGDVVEMRARPASDTDDAQRTSIWGHIAIEPSGTDAGPPVFKANLHTPFAELTVRRFGSPEGYRIRVPAWQIASRLPVFQSTWLLFVSLLALYGAYAGAAQRHTHWDGQFRPLRVLLPGRPRKKDRKEEE